MSAEEDRRPRQLRGLVAGTAIVILAVLALAVAAAVLSNGREAAARAAAMTGGEPARGASAILHYGCGYCHTIPGIRDADGLVGPPLGGIARRVYVAGVLQNNPQNLIRWIRNPQAVDPLTAMPNLGVTEIDARHIAAYLYTLR
jgi:cytochrome c1